MDESRSTDASLSNVIPASFDPQFRHQIYMLIKTQGGPKRIQEVLLKTGYHPSFARAIIRSITRKEGW